MRKEKKTKNTVKLHKPKNVTKIQSFLYIDIPT